jgi:hypothetical protein
MKKTVLVGIVALCAVLIAPLFAYGAGGPGPVKISTMTRVEGHTRIADINGNFSGQTYVYNMISATRQLEKSVIGNIFYLNQYDVDNSKMITHIGGATVIKVFSPYWIGTVGYTFSSNPEISTFEPLANQDRFSLSALYNFNPKSKSVKFSSMTGYGMQYNLLRSASGFDPAGRNKQRTLSEKLDATFPIINKKFTGNLGYTYTYGIDKDAASVRLGQLTNQYSANLTYSLCKDSKLVLGYLFIDKQFEGAPDDQVARLTLLHNFK